MKLISLLSQSLGTLFLMVWLLLAGYAAPAQTPSSSAQAALAQSRAQKASETAPKEQPTGWQAAEGRSLQEQPGRDATPLRRPPIRRRLAQFGQL